MVVKIALGRAFHNAKTARYQSFGLDSRAVAASEISCKGVARGIWYLSFRLYLFLAEVDRVLPPVLKLCALGLDRLSKLLVQLR